MPQLRFSPGGGFNNRVNRNFAFFQKFDSNLPSNSPPKTLNAFSIAEAMICLLLVSVAMAASAPLISKNLRNSAQPEPKNTSSMCWPDYSQQKYHISLSGTVSENGWLGWYVYHPDRTSIWLKINGKNILGRYAYKYGDGISVILPVKKGDTYSTGWGYIDFYPCAK